MSSNEQENASVGGGGGNNGGSSIMSPDMGELPVESPHVGASLPSAEEVRTSSASTLRKGRSRTVHGGDHDQHQQQQEEEQNGRRSRSGKSTSWMMPAVVGNLLLLVFIIVIVATLGGRRKDDNNGGSRGNGGGGGGYNDELGISATLAPGPGAALEDVIAYLSDQGISSETELNAENSPQNLAARWMAERDPAAFGIPTSSSSSSSSSSDPVLARQAEDYKLRYIMTLLYYSMDGDNWIESPSYMSAKPTCKWYDQYDIHDLGWDLEYRGVGCQLKGINIDLSNFGLGGTIPTELGLLTDLYWLNLSYSHIGGSIPTELCQLDKLEGLVLRGNSLTGQLPSCIGQLSNMRFLVIDDNEFQGEPPHSAMCENMPGLRHLGLAKNFFSGLFPDCYKSLTDLSLLHISDNLFSGAFPDLSALNLTDAYIDDNHFTGNINTLFEGWNDLLESLLINTNKFTGDLALFENGFQNLELFDMSRNEITAANGIPTNLIGSSKMRLLDLSDNLLDGSIPSEIGQATQLKFLALHDNSLTDDLPCEYMGDFEYLWHLDLSKNNFTGKLCTEFGDLTDLNYFFVGDNPFLDAGPIPPEYVMLENLRELSLKNSNRNGQIPDFLGLMSRLIILDLDNNNFAGQVSPTIGNLGMLKYLLLSRNSQVTGPLPDELASGLLSIVGITLDATGLTGDLSNFCPLLDDKDGAFIVAECGGSNTAITCTDGCCSCCPEGVGPEGCSQPETVNLAIEWNEEYGKRPETMTFGINFTAFEPDD